MIQLAQYVRGASMTSLPASMKGGIPKGVRLTGAPLMWARGSYGAGVKVGTIDTGVAEHPDLRVTTDGKPKIAGFRDYVKDGGRLQSGAASYDDHPHGHGTHVAGTIAANGHLKGVAPGAELMVYKILDWRGRGENDALTQAIRDAIADGCRVISMSLGSPERVEAWAAAIRDAVAAQRAVPVSAGNEGPGATSWPAAEEEVISVAAMMSDYRTGDWRRAWFSNTRSGVDLIAHGVDVLSCAPGGGYGYMSGTSQSQPHVAGMLALLIEDGDLALGAPMSERAIWEGIKSRSIRLPHLNRDEAGAGIATFYPSLPREIVVELPVSRAVRRVDDREEPLDVGATIVKVDDKGGERTMVPARHTHEPLGDQVSWDEPTRTVRIARQVIPGMEV